MLTFVLKKEWFEKIKAGSKRIEYREVKPYWTARLKNAALCICPYDPFGFPSRYGESEEYFDKKLECCFKCGYKSAETLKAFITKIEVINGLNTDLNVNKLVYAIHFANVAEC